MPILLLIRHATNDFVKTGRLPGHSPNIHLNEEGRAQAEALGRMLSQRKIHAVYASHLERAIETAFRVAAPHNLSIAIRPGMADIDNGDYTGKTIKEVSEGEATKELWKVVVETPSQAKFPNGEGMLDMQQRVVSTLDGILAAHPDLEFEEPAKEGEPDAKPTKRKEPQTVAVVAHADVIKAALAHYLGMPFDNFQRLGTSPASVSTVSLHTDEKTGKQHVMVQSVNQVS
jgi:broad specificity phosphatase PhoE